ncbi:hypothetical protein ACFYTS_35540 [Nocardia sp. NPDC004151]|uniref:hypothetical protein n=1 Tax=Nocardia sp. NPDC004151 TaxID=3364304 RepID=UPI0036C6E7D5
MWHDYPFCPFRRPQPRRVITRGEIQTELELRELERAGVISPRKPFRLRWVFLPMLALVVYFVLLLLL